MVSVHADTAVSWSDGLLIGSLLPVCGVITFAWWCALSSLIIAPPPRPYPIATFVFLLFHLVLYRNAFFKIFLSTQSESERQKKPIKGTFCLKKKYLSPSGNDEEWSFCSSFHTIVRLFGLFIFLTVSCQIEIIWSVYKRSCIITDGGETGIVAVPFFCLCIQPMYHTHKKTV